MSGSEKENNESSKQVLRLDDSYFDMPYEARIKYLRILFGTISPNPTVRARSIAELNALTDDQEDQN